MGINQLAEALLPGGGAKITQFAVMDLDQDGVMEVALRLLSGGSDCGVEVLRYQDGAVVGYAFGIRAMGEMKADGTFWFSSSAAENGYGLLKFGQNGYWTDNLSYGESRNDDNGTGPYFATDRMAYFVNRKPATLEAYCADVEQWNRRPAAP